jgi:anti-anti-sigma factor
MDRGRYFFAEKDDITFLKMVGNLKYTSSSGFDHFVDGLMERGYRNVLLDLSEATYIDSTNLGLIAKIAGRARNNPDVHVTILSPNEDINEILKSMHFDKLFTIVEEYPDNRDLEEIPDQERGRREDLRMLVEAHRALMDVHEKNRPQFKDVVELLESELKDF